MTTNVAYKQWLAEGDDSLVFLDKADGGKVTMDDVQGGLKEYKRLFKAGLASPAELLTLHRAYPDISKYANVVEILDLNGEAEPTVIGGPASVELVDREGHLITSAALEDAFERYMDNFRTRNVMVMHSDVQVGHALPVYVSKGGQIFKSGVEGENLFFISELRDDTKISKKVKEQITSGKMRSYSIAGSATKTKNISKGADSYMQVDGLELAEITICEKGVNQGAHFEIMKAEQPVPTEADDNLFVISKEDIPSFTEVFSTWFGKASKEGYVPELKGKQMAVLENGTARQIQHRALLDELGFPMYVYPENLRHPVDYDEPGRPVPSKIVNQAGQDLGDANIEEMVKSATDTFINILLKESPPPKPVETPVPRASRTETSTTYRGDLPDHAVPSDVKHKVKSDTPTQKASDPTGYHERQSKLDQIAATKKPTRYHGTVVTRTMSSPDVASQTTGAVPTTPPGDSLKTNISTKSKAVDKGLIGDVKEGLVGYKNPHTEKGLIGDIAGGAAKVGVAGVKGVGGALVGGAAGLTGSKQTVDWSGGKSMEFFAFMDKMNETTPVHQPNINPVDMNDYTGDEEEDKRTEKGFFQETAPRQHETGPRGKGEYVKGEDPGFADAPRSKKSPSYFNVGEHSLIQTSVDEDDEDESLKKSTDIFKRVLEAERPDETWTGTDKEKEVPIEKIIGALLAPVAGAIGAAAGAGLGLAGSAGGAVAGEVGKKILGG